jgi:hypothetical protein
MRAWMVVAVLCAAVPAARAATVVENAEYHFSFTVPDGFVDSPESKLPEGLYAFTRGTRGQPGFALLQLEPMRGTIGRQPLMRDVLEKAARNSAEAAGATIDGFAYHSVRWQGFELEAVITRLSAGGQKLSTVAVQVPLAKAAIMAHVSGAATDEARLEADLGAVLATLTGKSNWLTDGERSARLGEAVGRVVGLLIGLGGALWLALWIRRRRAAAR